MATPDWIRCVRRRGVLAVAHELGHKVTPPRGASEGAVFGCPACNAVTRHTKSGDKRGAVGVNELSGWWCVQCEVTGDALDFVAYRLRGDSYQKLMNAGRDEVRSWCASTFADVADALERPKDDASRPRPRVVVPPLPSSTTPSEPKATNYLPTDDVAALWDACTPIDSDAEVLAYLSEKRRVNVSRIVPLDVARALPLDVRPKWTTHKPNPNKHAATWAQTGHRLIVPLYDNQGTRRSVLARDITGSSPRKSTTNGQRTGLVMANPIARSWLALGEWPEGAASRLIVAEGEIDFLQWCAAHGSTRGVLGIFAGSWTQEHADRIPSGSVLLVATDNDEQGNKYAAQITATLARRMARKEIEARRWNANQ